MTPNKTINCKTVSISGHSVLTTTSHQTSIYPKLSQSTQKTINISCPKRGHTKWLEEVINLIKNVKKQNLNRDHRANA